MNRRNDNPWTFKELFWTAFAVGTLLYLIVQAGRRSDTPRDANPLIGAADPIGTPVAHTDWTGCWCTAIAVIPCDTKRGEIVCLV